MKFLLDANVPAALAVLLEGRGHDVLLCADLPEAHRSKDGVLNEISLREERIVVTKDKDFFHSLALQGRPWKLLLLRTGNLRLRELKACFAAQLLDMESSLTTGRLYELYPLA